MTSKREQLIEQRDALYADLNNAPAWKTLGAWWDDRIKALDSVMRQLNSMTHDHFAGIDVDAINAGMGDETTAVETVDSVDDASGEKTVNRPATTDTTTDTTIQAHTTHTTHDNHNHDTTTQPTRVNAGTIDVSCPINHSQVKKNKEHKARVANAARSRFSGMTDSTVLSDISDISEKTEKTEDKKNVDTFTMSKRRNEYGEWVIKCYRDGERFPNGDYHTDDKQDAIGALALMVKRANGEV